MRAVACLALLAVAACTGCATLRGEVPMREYDTMPELALVMPQGQSGGLYAAGHLRALTADDRAWRVGDVLTVRLQEATQASNRSDSAISKQSSVEMGAGRLLGADVDLDSELGLRRGSSGSGATTQEASLSGSVTVVVQQVLPNGLLQVDGQKSLMLNQGVETVRLRGYVRPGDIDTSNMVSSQRVANARIQYSGRGTVANASRSGWLARFFTHPLAPL